MVKDVNKTLDELARRLEKAQKEGRLKITLPPGKGSSLNRVLGTKEKADEFMKKLKSL